MLGSLPTTILLDIAILFTALCWGLGFFIADRKVYLFASSAHGRLHRAPHLAEFAATLRLVDSPLEAAQVTSRGRKRARFPYSHFIAGVCGVCDNQGIES